MKAKIQKNKCICCFVSQSSNISGLINPSENICAETEKPENICANSTQRGAQGIPGEAATIQVGTVTTGEPGTDAIVTNVGTSSAAIFNFTIPRGDKGDTPTSLSAADVTYHNETYPTVEAALDKLLYVEPTVTISGGGTYEIGYTKATTTLTWVWNKTITSQSLNQGIGSLAADVRTYTYETAIDSNTTFTITGSDGTNSKSASTSVTFQPKRYWGVSANTTLTDEQILALSSELSTSRTQTRTFDCSGGKYFYLVIRTDECSGIKFKVGGLSFSDMNVVTRNVVNAQGYTASYNIYRPNNIQTGSAISVEVL